MIAASSTRIVNSSNYKLDDFSEESWGSPAIARVTTGRGKAVTQLLIGEKGRFNQQIWGYH